MTPSPLGTKEFGNTIHQLRSICIAGFILTAIVAGLFAGAAYHAGRLESLSNTLPITLLIGSILPLVVAPTCLFSIRITRDKIQHLFLRKWILGEGQIEDLTQVEIGKSTGVIFCFKNGSAIRFPGAHLRILEAMCLYLQERRPDFSNFKFATRTAFNLALIHTLNPRGLEQTYDESRF